MAQMQSWDEVWKDFGGLNWFGKRLYKAQKKIIRAILFDIVCLPEHAKILDLGCGTGRSLSWFCEFGFKHSIIGIDPSLHSLKLCEEKGFVIGKDVFLMDGRQTDFREQEFELVFAEGVLEHFENIEPFVKEMCRITKHFILITQPNHFSLWNKVVRTFGNPAVHEFTYSDRDFINAFKKWGYILVTKKDFNLNEQFALLFKRKGDNL